MNWIEIITKAINFIENNLCDPNLSTDMVSKEVNISSGHFSRGFNILTSFTVSEYIRNRRLSLAYITLKSSGKSVLDVALDIGYESPEAFSKAFKRFYGVNPNESKNIDLKEFFPLQVKLTLIQETPLSPIICEKEELILKGNTQTVPSDDLSTVMLWKTSAAYGYLDYLYSFKDLQHLVGIYHNDTYTIKCLCAKKSENSFLIPKSKWAVFTCTGDFPKCINETFEKIYSSWLSKNSVEISDLPQLEVYKENEDGYSCEIWIPLK